MAILYPFYPVTNLSFLPERNIENLDLTNSKIKSQFWLEFTRKYEYPRTIPEVRIAAENSVGRGIKNGCLSS